MGRVAKNASKERRGVQMGKTEPRKRFIIKLKLPTTKSQLNKATEQSKLSPVEKNAAAHSIADGDFDEKEHVGESEDSNYNDSSSDDQGSSSGDGDSYESDEDSSIEELDDIFYEQSAQGIENPILINATKATDDDWEDFFRLAANKGNKEILNLVKAADPSSTLNIKRVINMVFKGQGRIAKIRGVSLSSVRKGFHKAREINGVRERQQTIRQATMKQNGTGPKGRKYKRGKKKITKTTTTMTRTKKTTALEDLEEQQTGLEKMPPVSKKIFKPEKSKEELEIGEAAAILIKACADALEAEKIGALTPAMASEQMRLQAANTLLSISQMPRHFGVESAQYI